MDKSGGEDDDDDTDDAAPELVGVVERGALNRKEFRFL
jgi:hypothetical protein